VISDKPPILACCELTLVGYMWLS